jgi:hypothetical protein
MAAATIEMRAPTAHATRGRMAMAVLLAAAAGVAGVVAALGPGEVSPAQSASQYPVVAAAGDIACDPNYSAFNDGKGTSDECRQLYTSRLLRPSLAEVLPLGDNQYSDGRLWKYRRSYHRSWGQFRPISRPVPGNHEYVIPDAAGYFKYFNGDHKRGRAGTTGKGFYSFNVGTWHLIALNSNCGKVSCSFHSRQLDWLRADLAKHAASKCVLAFWHHPWFLSGHAMGYKPRTRPFLAALYAAHADVVLNGHFHVYERFAPQDPNGNHDPGRGIREFIAGTGGRSHERFGPTAKNSQVRDPGAFGVLKLTLKPARYRWRFVTEAGQVLDRGDDGCH